MVFFGERWRRCRHAAHLTQAELAENMGRRRPTVSLGENGHHSPWLVVAQRVATVLRVRVDDPLEERGVASVD